MMSLRSTSAVAMKQFLQQQQRFRISGSTNRHIFSGQVSRNSNNSNNRSVAVGMIAAANAVAIAVATCNYDNDNSASFNATPLTLSNSSANPLSLFYYTTKPKILRCEEAPQSPSLFSSMSSPSTNQNEFENSNDDETTNEKEGMQSNAVGMYYDLFPLRQLWQPKLIYPLYDKDWDGRHPKDSDDMKQHLRKLRKHGITRHIILIRHGQYDETYKEDEKRILTPLGREQAVMTGKRIAEIIQGSSNHENDGFTSCSIKSVFVSDLARAKETAQLIVEQLQQQFPSSDNSDNKPMITVEEPDPLLNEGRPCHTIPGGPVSQKTVETTDLHHPRIEKAFQKYFYRSTIMPNPDDTATASDKHEFEIIVCHANVIRYMFCRALQLPPEAWLRLCPFNCSLTYLTIRPTGTVSCRMVGDIGHLPYTASTFSGHHGYNW